MLTGALDDRVRRVAAMAAVMLIMVVSSAPAAAQRPGRRWRGYQSPPRPTAPPPPASPTPLPSTPPASAGSQSKMSTTPAPDARKAPVDAKKGAERPQTTSTEGPSGAERVAWDGPAPFGDEWRARHPAAWRPEEVGGDVILAGGPRVPTGADQDPTDLAQWTGPSPVAAKSPRSVLQESGEEVGQPPAPVATDRPDELVIFPGADGSIPLTPVTTDTGEQPPAADGTVSVLVRESAPPAPPAAASSPLVVARFDADQAGASPWLPLGAFAAVPSTGERNAVPHIFLELSLHRDGVVRGNYFDAVSDAVHPVKGRFDRETGTLTWKIGGGGAEFETSADGLTAGRVEATVRRGDVERTWTLISLP